MHWSEQFSKPADPGAMPWRRQTLAAALKPPVRDRIDYLQSLAEGRRVLDVGVVAHAIDRETQPQWLHRKIAEVARECIGVDVLEAEAEQLNQAGYHVVICDITDAEAASRHPDFQEPFDLIVVGEVIEHLGHPQGLFRTANRLLAPGGRMVMTTPNPHYIARMKRAFLGKFVESVDHTTLLFPSGIAEMAEREGLLLDTWRGVLVAEGGTLKGRLFHALRGLLFRLGMAREVACDTMIYEVIRPET